MTAMRLYYSRMMPCNIIEYFSGFLEGKISKLIMLYLNIDMMMILIFIEGYEIVELRQMLNTRISSN